MPPAVAHNWAQETDPYLHGYWDFDWLDGYLPLKGVDPAHNGLLVGKDGAQQAPLTKAATGARYYVFNLLAELDNPGEFYLSRHGETAGEQATRASFFFSSPVLHINISMKQCQLQSQDGTWLRHNW